MTKRNKKSEIETNTSMIDELAALSAQLDAEAEVIEAATPVVAEIEIVQAQAEPTVAPAAVIEPIAIVHVEGDLKEMVERISSEDAGAMTKKIADSFSDRIAFEKLQPGLSSKMVPNLEAAATKMATIGTAAIFAAINVDPAFINREVATGSRFNVYGLQKVNDVVTGLGAGILQNAINRSILMSMFNFRAAGVPFTGNAALGAVSDKIKVDRAISKHLVRHTVSQSTASTQKSSSMNALEVLGIVTSNKLRGDAEVFTLTDTPQTRRLEKVLMAA